MNEPGLLAALGIVSACVAGLIWVIKHMFNDIVPALDGLKASTVQNILATKQNTRATKFADTYLKERNGRDIEKHAELLKATQQIPSTMQKIADSQAKAIIKAVKVREQHVEHQHVDKQDIGE